MGSGITFSGFNSIDFNVVLNAIMTQESQPLVALQAQQRALQTTDSNYAALATKLSNLHTATDALAKTSTFVKYAATSSDSAAISASVTGTATPGRYELIVSELARAQTTVSSSFAADVDTTIVATGGTLTLGGEDITLTGSVTLSGLAAAINANDDVPARASIVETQPGQFHLVLTGKDTGESNSFAIVTSGLTGASVAFADPSIVEARNAEVSINGINIESESNTLASGVPGVTVTLNQKDAGKTVAVTVDRNDDDLINRVEAFAIAYNDLVKFSNDQTAAANKGTAGTLGRDSLLKSLRSSLRSALTALPGGGTYEGLAEVGIGFNRTGQLTVNRTALQDALTADPSAVQDLFTNSTTGIFTSVNTLIDEYTQTDGFVPDARSRLTDQISRIGKRSDDLTARLAVRRAALQREFIAADQAMSRLKSQQGALSGFSTSLISNTP